ncbi:MAG: thioredoxin family protein [Fibrobacter sp.]|nr:thioredoxin family protein [Fibrobacter sp.]
MNSMPPPEMSMSYSAGALKAGAKLTVNIVVPDNWHVNANIAADEFLKPSSIDVSAKGIHFGAPVWPEAIKEYSEALDMENLVFRGSFDVILPVDSVDSEYDSLSTIATFHYQACDNSICLAPAEKSIDLKGTNLSTAKKNDGEKFDLIFEDEKKDDAEEVAGKNVATEEVAGKNVAGNKDAGKPEGSADVGEGSTDLGENSTDLGKGSADAGENSAGTLILLLSALLGGLILNLMPCVLPVLSLKLFSLIKQAGESRGRLLVLGFSTAAGILASFWILAAVITIIKIGGGNAGWGMQFQSAGFIAFMVVILSAFAMSFFGVFEVWLPWGATTKMDEAGRKSGIAGAFFTGALLVLLSTPCSAPFLGTAMGFAFTASAPVLFLFFTAAAIGLAAPYLLVSAFPAVLKVFPKPGPWMVKLQKVMGVLLMATVCWLLWIVNEQAGGTGVGLFAVVAVLAIAASFALGKIAPPGSAFVREVSTFVVAVIVIAAVWFAVLAPRYEAVVQARFDARISEQKTEDGWYRYSPALIEELAAAGRTVFIDVTADWCITCKANEAAVIGREDFARAMDSLNVVRVKADWTRETPEVNALLRSLGKSGVPAYAIYPAGDASKQIVLPEILTTGGIVEKITQ